ncbi:MAG: CHAT domain-containing protein [Propionibacteriaceae bacterium]|jgi:hypothetical protein|nr:CHAT domain-containing protein [Propionibacteriaceae bacterium]
MELWSHLDRSAKSDPVVAELGRALFPAPLVAALTEAGGILPVHLLIVPGPYLWNLPWSGLVVADDHRLVSLARVSLTPSLTGLATRSPSGRTAVNAWIPPAGPGFVKGADLLRLDLPEIMVIGACWSSRVDSVSEPYALPLIAHARGAHDIIGGIYPLPDSHPFPTARLLTQLYPALLGTDPATALWLAQHEAAMADAAPHTWAGVIHTTVTLTGDHS